MSMQRLCGEQYFIWICYSASFRHATGSVIMTLTRCCLDANINSYSKRAHQPTPTLPPFLAANTPRTQAGSLHPIISVQLHSGPTALEISPSQLAAGHDAKSSIVVSELRWPPPMDNNTGQFWYNSGRFKWLVLLIFKAGSLQAQGCYCKNIKQGPREKKRQ